MKTNPILESIRLQTNRLTAGYLRDTAGADIKESISVALGSERCKTFERGMVDELVDELIREFSSTALRSIIGQLAEIDGESESAKAARKAIMQSVNAQCQYIKNTVHGAAFPILQNLRARVGELVAEIVSEAMIVSAMNTTSKALPLPEKGK